MAINTNLKTTNIEADEELKSYLAKRVAKFEQFIRDNDTSAIADIELERMGAQQSGQIYRAEVNLKFAGDYLRAEAEAEDIRSAIDAMREEMIRELRDVKEKRQTKTRKGAREAKEMLRDESQAADAEEIGQEAEAEGDAAEDAV